MAFACSAVFDVPPGTATCISFLSMTARPGADWSSSTSFGAPIITYELGSARRMMIRRVMFDATAVGTAPARSAVITACTPSGRPSLSTRRNPR